MAFAGHEETSSFGGWESLSLSGGYVQGRGDGIAPSAIYIGGPDYQIGRENVGGQLVPMDEPLREVGTDLVPVRSPMEREGTPSPPLPTVPVKQLDPIPASPNAQSARPKKRRPQQTEKSSAQVAEPAHSQVPDNPAPVATPKPETQVAETSFRESAKEFASGFGKGVRDESERIYRDAKELPDRIAKTGREFVEDLKEGRRLRALAPIEAIGHAIQNASSDDVERLAHGVIDSARDFYHKPAKEKGQSLGRATMSIASDAAISALTDGLGTLATLRKADKVAEAAEHVRDAERVVGRLERGTLNASQAENLARFEKKLPVGAQETAIYGLPSGGRAFVADVPGRVPGSKAVYEKQVNLKGETVQYTKTTIDPAGNIVHVKDKIHGTEVRP